MKPLISLAIGQIVPVLFFYKDGLGIKWPIQVDMPLKKETETDKKVLKWK